MAPRHASPNRTGHSHVLSARGQSRRSARHSDEGSILVVLFIVITASIMIATAMGVSMSQLLLAGRTFQRTDALEAAQAGLDAAIGEIRAANDGAGNGVLSKLPCNQPTGVPNTTLIGSVDVGQVATYKVSITYLTADPSGNTSNTTWLTSHDISCSGTAPASVPSYALLSATASDPKPGTGFLQQRTVDETYYFRTTNANISGGLIRDYQQNMCLADNRTSGDPAANDTLTMASCTVNSPEQTWAYRSDFTIVLTSTESGGSAGLCLTEGNNYTTITLQACSDGVWTGSSPASSPSYTQQWGVDDTGRFEAVTKSGGNPTDDCITTGNNPPVLGDSVSVQTCSGGFSDNQTWLPSAQVGAGDASASTTQQFVNFEEFGRCIDITNQDPTSGYPNGAGPGGSAPPSGGTGPGGFLIDYMCKQFPNTTSYPAWNQRFKMVPVTYHSNSYWELQSSYGTTYCLWSPLSVQSPTTHAWAEETPCSGAPLANIAWTVNYATGSSMTSYTLQDSNGNCLEANLADPQKPGGNGDAFTTIAVATCTGAYNQKWNAPPTLGVYGVNNAFEPSVAGN